LNHPQKSHEELRAFFSQTIDGCFFMMLDEPVHWDETADKERVLDYVFAHQHITQINDAMLAQYGATADQMLKLTPNDFFKHNLTHGRDLWRRLFDAGKIRLESDERKLDGTPMWIEGEYILLYDSEGRITGHFGIQRDVTERKRAEEALRESETQQRAVLTALPDLMFLCDADGRFVDYYAADPSLLFLPPGDFLGKTITESIPPELTARLEAARTETLRSGKVQVVEFAGTVAAGLRHFEARFARCGETHTVTIVRDITERKRAEEALRRSEAYLAEAQRLSHTGSWAWNVTTREFVHWSQEHYRMYGLDPKRGIPSWEAVQQLIHPEDRARCLESIDRAIRERTDCYLDYRAVLPDGTIKHIHSIGRPVFNASGDLVEFVGTEMDITERKRAEEARAKLEEQLRHSQKMESIGRLASGMAHDFNNLLTVIRGCVDLMQDTMAAEAPWIEDLEQVRRASERAAALIRQLLAFSRQQILTPTVLDLNGLVANLHKMLGRLIGEDITLSTILQPGPWPITADPGQIEQVIMNLVINARDAMPTGGRLTIETGNVHLDDSYAATHLEAPTGPCVMLAVTDTGHGMDKPTQERIFEPFFTTKEQGKGTGLGLATVYGIVKQSGGHITVYSEPGLGATFKIYLPASKTTAQGPAAPQLQLVTHGGQETILLVEDDEPVRSLVQRALQAEGYTILEACSGDEALSLAGQYQGRIDLLLTDVVMPQMSGRELAEQLKALYPQMKVLFMSGYTNDTVVRHGLLTAEIELLSKPFAPSVLVFKVREALEK
jgi:PAS domain S-box-containing protein